MNDTKCECIHCKSTFSSPSLLNRHQRTAKYCLKLQNRESDIVCDYCDKTLSSLQQLRKHMKKCEGERKPYEQKIVFSQSEVEKYRQLYLDALEKVKEYSKCYIDYDSLIMTVPVDERCFMNDVVGLVDFAKIVFENRVKCTDTSRKIFKYQTKEGIIFDNNGHKFRRLFFQILKHSESILNKLLDRYKEELSVESEEEMNENAKNNFMKLLDMKVAIDQESEGIHSEIGSKWLRELVMSFRVQ